MLKLFGKLRKRERLLTIICALLVLGRCWLELLLPGYMKDLTLLIQMPGTTPETGWEIGRKMLVSALGSAALAVPAGWCGAQAAAGFAYSLRESVFCKLTELDKAEMDRFSVSGLLSCTADDVNRLQWMLNRGLQAIVRVFVVFGVVSLRISGKRWLPGDLLELGGYGICVILSLLELGAVLRQLPAVHTSVERILAVLDAEPSVLPGAKSQGGATGSLEFRRVSFAYPGGEHNVVENISIRAKKGQMIAVMGASGSGKSTLTDLAARLYDPKEGQILLDGVDLREYTFEALYNRLGYVPQKAMVFSGSIRSNIFFGESAATNRECDLKAALAGIPGEALPDRMEQSGRTLSMGQRQRLAIARVLARKPEILILDDCFERLEHQAFRKLLEDLRDTTVLLATNQIDLAKMADHVLVLERGRLVGQGTHEELLKRCPAYQDLAADQCSSAEMEAN